MVGWVPILFVTFKLLAFGTCMFFAIKWHYDKEKNERGKRAVLSAAGTVAAVLLLLLLGLGVFAFVLIKTLGLDMTLP
mgnify:FL=1